MHGLTEECLKLIKKKRFKSLKKTNKNKKKTLMKK